MANGYRASWKANRDRSEYWGRLHYYSYKGRRVKVLSHRKEREFQRALTRKALKEAQE